MNGRDVQLYIPRSAGVYTSRGGRQCRDIIYNTAVSGAIGTDVWYTCDDLALVTSGGAIWYGYLTFEQALRLTFSDF